MDGKKKRGRPKGSGPRAPFTRLFRCPCGRYEASGIGKHYCANCLDSARAARECARCGELFKPGDRDHFGRAKMRQFCGSYCQQMRAADNAGARRIERTADTVAERKRIALQQKARRDLERILSAKAPFTPIRFCACGAPFHAARGTGKRCKKCSASRAAINMREYKRAYKKKNGSPRRFHLHRARKTGAAHDGSITAKKLAMRDGMKCQVCGGKVEPHVGRGFQPRGWSVGHIVPMSSGGSHTWDNVQCEHVSCNVKKGTRALGQISLFSNPSSFSN